MIRFCDREIDCVEYSSLTRSDLLSYFLPDHKEDILCVYDDFNTMKYVGIITYDSYKHSLNIEGAIKQEYVILNADIWQNARKYFGYNKKVLTVDRLLPVLDEEDRLICFAYEDMVANREIRMLRELQETQDALQFTDIFSEYKCVKIHGFNELAFSFAKYLERIGVFVEVDGTMWNTFFNKMICQIPDNKCIDIYAEGVYGRGKMNDSDTLLRTVSVEFEYIDKIYEANVQKGIICDAAGDEKWFIDILRNSKEIIIIGTNQAAQDVYDYMIGQGIDICCFVNEEKAEQSHRLLGKSILSLQKAKITYENPIFIDCTFRNSAWGFGQVDYFDYMGYRRNEKYFMIKDYVNVSGNSLINVLSRCEVVLVGEAYICKCLYDYFSSKGVFVIGYLDVQSQNIRWDEMRIEAQDVNVEAIYLLAAPDFFISNEINYQEPYKLKNSLIEYLKEIEIDNYSDYFSYMPSYMNMYEGNGNKYFHKQLIPKRIIIGSIEGGNGSIFFEGLLDGHPNILLLPNTFAGSLFWMGIRLSTVESEDILSVFWELYKETDCNAIHDPAKFNEKMEELLAYGNQFTSQEILVMIYIAYMHMCGNDISIAEGIVFWSPHYLTKKEKEGCTKWLGTEQVHCDIINIVRNAYMSRGVHVKGYISRGWAGAADNVIALKYAYKNGVYAFSDIDEEIYKWSNRLIIQFEELKCYPKETLKKICTEWDITWSDSLMQTTRMGEKRVYYNGEKAISDFDLTPVYNTYEKYFSEYDRLRIMLIQALWQRKYGYPYVESKEFSRRELQEMFLKPFRFENLVELDGKGLDLNFRMMLQYTIRNQLLKIRMVETMK
ncbi:MAG: hypothetical protein HDR13_13760 [Lachnospiraceae bacterium]|nr:hypothetical protein [Lachnospiraceae bacterium]